jgi:cobalt-zinc-cadmium efflux system membrane fusion protein
VAVADSSPVALASAARAHNAVTLTRVRESRLAGDIQLTGSVSYDADHFAMVGPLVAGRVARLDTQVGARVRRGQVLAEIESVDVGQARAELISAGARLGAATSNLKRERELAEKKISSSREREVAEAQWAIERAAVRAARERLRAIGLSDTDIQAVETRDEDAPTGGRVPIRSPIEGTIIERLVTLGEAVQSASDAFKVADLRRVWVQLDLYEKDLARVRVSLPVEIRTDAYPGEIFQGRVAYVAPVIDEATRTAKVRVEIDNRQDKLHIGQLVSAKLSGRAQVGDAAVLVIPRSAVQRLDGKPLVFVKVAAGFERAFVELGAAGDDWIEVRRGLAKDQEIAADGGFLLKSELLR